MAEPKNTEKFRTYVDPQSDLYRNVAKDPASPLLWHQYDEHIAHGNIRTNEDLKEKPVYDDDPKAPLLLPATEEILGYINYPVPLEKLDIPYLPANKAYCLGEPLSPKQALARWGWAPMDAPRLSTFVRNQLQNTPQSLEIEPAPFLKPEPSAIHVRGKLMKEVFAYLKQGHVPKGQYIHNFPKFLQSIAWTCQEPKELKSHPELNTLRSETLLSLCHLTRTAPCRFISFSADCEEYDTGFITWDVAVEISRSVTPKLQAMTLSHFMEKYDEDFPQPQSLFEFTVNALRKLGDALGGGHAKRRLRALMEAED